MEVSLEAVCSSDSLRVAKSNRLVGVALDPVGQASLCLLMSSGRLLVYSLVCSLPPPSFPARPEQRQEQADEEGGGRPLSELVRLTGELGMEPRGRVRLALSGLVSGLTGTPTVVRWRPAAAGGGGEEAGEGGGELAAVGTSEGGVQLVRLDGSGAGVERDWAIHGAPVRCLEWGGPLRVISAAYTPTLSTSAVVRNELVVTDIRTGAPALQSTFLATASLVFRDVQNAPTRCGRESHLHSCRLTLPV